MKTIKITFGLLLLAFAAFAQKESPVKWSFSSRKKADNVYEVVLSASVSKPWHIYSQFTPKGGPLATDITFATNPIVVFDGDVKESGKLLTNYDKSFKVDVKYFSDKVEFVQTVKTRGAVQTDVRGTIEYMVCDDSKCLPPVKQPFEIKLQ
ncbi:MAG: protein-disulfide reductase DsbD family protein [Chryseolinea sp.]